MPEKTNLSIAVLCLSLALMGALSPLYAAADEPTSPTLPGGEAAGAIDPPEAEVEVAMPGAEAAVVEGEAVERVSSSIPDEEAAMSEEAAPDDDVLNEASPDAPPREAQDAADPWDMDIPPAGYAGDETEEDLPPGLVMQALQGGQAAVTRGVVRLSRGMDRMLGARQTFPDEAYDSVLRARFIQRLDDAGGSRLEPEISGRVSLPGAEERWSVIFLSDDYDDPVDRERGTDREIDETTRRSIALRYLQPLREWESSLSAGLRSGDPIDLLLRGRLWRDFQAGTIGIRPTQTVFWYDQRGLGASAELRLEYPFGILKLLRSNTSATWFRRDERLYYDQVLSLLHPLSRRRALLWQVGMQAESEPNDNVTNYYAQVRWRSLVHSNWLIFEVRPQLIRERENDFRVDRRLYLGFELHFGIPTR